MLKARVPLLSVLLVGLLSFCWAMASRNSGGSYSLPSGNPVVTGTTISTTWANTTLADLATEVTNSLDRQGRGGMLAPLKLVAGSAGAPSLSWSLEPGSGPWRAGAGDIRWSILGTPVLKLQGALITTLVPLTVTGRTTTTDLTVTGSSDSLAVTALTPNAYGVAVLANGTGTGVTGTGGATNGTGVQGLGGGATGLGGSFLGGTGVAIGIAALGGSTGGNAGQFDAQGGNATGVTANGHGSSAGVQGTGGATSGAGIIGLGGAPNGIGLQGFSQGTGAGVYGSAGASGGAGIEGANAVAATGAVRQDAIRAGSGDINLNGTANATSTTAMLNRLAPNNIVKAWGTFTIGAAGAVTITDGFNIASAASNAGGTTIDVVYAQGFSNSTYAVTVSSANQACTLGPRIVSQNSAQVSIGFSGTAFDSITPAFGVTACVKTPGGSGASATSNWNGMKFTLIAIGAQ